jgi:hypothetical protein
MGKGQGRNQECWEPAVVSGSRPTGHRRPQRLRCATGRGPGGEASWPATDGVRSAATAASASGARGRRRPGAGDGGESAGKVAEKRAVRAGAAVDWGRGCPLARRSLGLLVGGQVGLGA